MEPDKKLTSVKKHVLYTTPEELEFLREVAEQEEEFFTHDKFVYAIWSILEIARCFFKHFLPPEILKNVKLETLRRVPTRMIDENGTEKEGDLFYAVDTLDGEETILVIILEHKSGPARYAALQTLGYEVDLMKSMSRNSKLFKNADGRLPTPFTVVLAQYDVPQLDELFYRVKGTSEYGPFFRFHTVNLQKLNFDFILDEEPMLFVAMALSAFAYRLLGKEWDVARNAELLEIFSHVLDQDPTDSENYSFFFKVLLKYTAWFTRPTSFEMGKFVEDIMETYYIRYDGKPVHSFYSRVLGDKAPEAYKKLEAKYDESFLKNLKLNEELKLVRLQQSIQLDAGVRFNVPLPLSVTQRLLSIDQAPLLSEIRDSLQKSASVADFERDFNRLVPAN